MESVGAAILRVAGAHGADLLVVGARGRMGDLSEVLGSVAEHVAHHARVPVLLVRPVDHASPGARREAPATGAPSAPATPPGQS